MKNPSFVSGLLEHIGAYVDPLRLIKRIPSGMEIQRLRDRIVKIISDYNLQVPFLLVFLFLFIEALFQL
jgi:hypothetical protein